LILTGQMQTLLYTTIRQDSSIGIATGYRLDGRGIEVRFSAGAEDFSLLQSVQNDFGAHPAAYTMGARGLLPQGKGAGA
jgi:hypothetical protein